MSPPLSYNAVFVLVILELRALWKNYSRQVWQRRLHPSEKTRLHWPILNNSDELRHSAKP